MRGLCLLIGLVIVTGCGQRMPMVRVTYVEAKDQLCAPDPPAKFPIVVYETATATSGTAVLTATGVRVGYTCRQGADGFSCFVNRCDPDGFRRYHPQKTMTADEFNSRMQYDPAFKEKVESFDFL